MAKDDLPAYEQVKAWIRQHIASGEWKPGDPVPSEAALMEQFGISRMTANRALRELAAEGLVTRVQGSGTRVAAAAPHLVAADHPRHPRGGGRARPRAHARACCWSAQEKAGAELAAVAGPAHGRARCSTPCWCTWRTACPSSTRTATSTRRRRPDYLDTDFTQTSPTLHLLQHAPLTEASYSIEACLPTARGGARAGHQARRALPGDDAAHRERRQRGQRGAAGLSRLALQLRGAVPGMKLAATGPRC